MSRVSAKETVVGVVILVALAAAAAGIFFIKDSHRPEPNDVAAKAPEAAAQRSAETSKPVEASATDFEIPPGAIDVNPPESFGPDSLSDKINGKSDFYLSAGFVKLSCRRFAQPETRTDWVDACSFIMKSPMDAFSVYSRQRRNADTLEFPNITRGYTTSTGFYFVTGNRYFEVNRSSDSDAARKLAIEFVQGLPQPDSGASTISELSLLPLESLIKGTETIHLSGAFGFTFPGPVVSAGYGDAANPVTVFVHQAESQQQASELVQACITDLTDMGAVRSSIRSTPEGSALFEAAGRFELVGSAGNLVYGVHDADGAQSALTVAQRTRLSLKALSHDE
jgi:hypothetical protein